MPGLSINLILAAITYYTALLVHYFGAPSGQSCPLGRRASTISLRLIELRDALLADHAGAVRSTLTLRPQLPDCPSCRSNDLLAPSQVGAADGLILRWDQYREESIGPPTDRKQLSTERIRMQQLLPA